MDFSQATSNKCYRIVLTQISGRRWYFIIGFSSKMSNLLRPLLIKQRLKVATNSTRILKVKNESVCSWSSIRYLWSTGSHLKAFWEINNWSKALLLKRSTTQRKEASKRLIKKSYWRMKVKMAVIKRISSRRWIFSVVWAMRLNLMRVLLSATS